MTSTAKKPISAPFAAPKNLEYDADIEQLYMTETLPQLAPNTVEVLTLGWKDLMVTTKGFKVLQAFERNQFDKVRMALALNGEALNELYRLYTVVNRHAAKHWPEHKVRPPSYKEKVELGWPNRMDQIPVHTGKQEVYVGVNELNDLLTRQTPKSATFRVGLWRRHDPDNVESAYQVGFFFTLETLAF